MFVIDAKLEDFENQNDWYGAVNYLEDKWLNDKSNFQNVIRLSTECWYILVFYERIFFNKEINRGELEKTLNALIKYGDNVFDKESNYLWLSGYMRVMFPYYYADYEYDESLDYGKKLIKRALILQPDNSIIRKIHDLCIDDKDETKIAINELSCYFPGNSSIEVYFKGILGS